MSQEQNEAKIPLDEIIKRLAEQIEKLTKIIEKSTKGINDNNDANKDWHKYQAMMKIELEKEHGRQVRLNKEYARSSASLEMFTGLLSRGASVGLVFKSLTGAITGVSKELDKYKAEHAELMRMEKEFAKKNINVGRGDLELQGNEMEREQHRRQLEAVDKAKEGKGGKEGKLAEGISSMKEFANKHKTGILIGAGSIGILLTVLKKAFDVSPMFQAIKKLLHFGFMLILRPIGDFFGFIMRPIMVMMLRKFIIPWYKDVYPVMKKLGTWIGNSIVPTIEGMAAVIAGIHEGLKKLGLTDDEATTTGVAAVGVGAVAAGVGTAYVGGKLIKKGLGLGGIKADTGKVTSDFDTADDKKNEKKAEEEEKKKTRKEKVKEKMKETKVKMKDAANQAKQMAKATTKVTGAAQKAAQMAAAKAAAMVTAKAASKFIPIAGQVLLAVDAAGSIMKKFAPEQHEGVRQGALSMGALLGDTEGTNTEHALDFFGFGKQSTAEFIQDKINPYLGDETAIGGGAGGARGDRGVVINIANVSKEVDVQHIGAIVSTELQKQNKRSHKF